MKNFRVQFEEFTIKGLVKRSTPWMSSKEECLNSKWFKMYNAIIIQRNG